MYIINSQFLSCCTSQPKKLKQIITVNSSTNAPITKNNSCTLCVPMFKIYCCLQLLQQDPKKRLDSLEALKQESLMADVDWESVEAVNVQPGFVPPVS